MAEQTLEERVTRLEKQVRVLQQMVFQLVGKARKGRPAGDMGLSRTAGQWVGLDEYRKPVGVDNVEGGTAEADTGDMDATGDKLVDDGTAQKLCPEGED